MTTVFIAKLALHDPERLPALLDEMEGMSPAELDAMSALVFEVVRVTDRSLSLMALTRIMALRPEWVNKEETTGYRYTPLIAAVRRGPLSTVSFLLDAGAQTHAISARGLNALDYAAHQDFNRPGLDQLCEVLLDKGEFTQQQKDAALYHAATNGNLVVVSALLAHGAGFTKEMQKVTALGAACMASESDYPTVEIVRSMLATNAGHAQVNEGWDIPVDGAPIHCAAYNGNIGVLSVLAAAGAWINPPPDIPYDGPATPLMSAAQGMRIKAVEFLVKAGADSGLVDAKGRNALHHMANYDPDFHGGHPPVPVMIRIVDALVAAGTNPLAEDFQGITPQVTARSNKNVALADHLAAITSAQGLYSGTPGPVSKPAAAGPRL